MTSERVESLVADLTLAEKIDLVHGDVDPEGQATGYVPPVERLDVPALRLVDGPLGVRVEAGRATAFPASIALAATWGPSLAREQGAAMGREARAYGQDVLLGPGVNIARAPQCGRNFEYYGEDPQLAARLAVGTVEGVQSEGVAATVKHYAANNQETNRYAVDAEVSERALREIYLPAFRAAVEEGDAGAVMTAYNRINGTYASEHPHLLGDVLRGEFGFDGIVMSDWYGTESTVPAAEAGLDLEMPGVTFAEMVPDGALPEGLDPDEMEFPDTVADMQDTKFFADPLREAVESGAVDESVVDAKVRRILGTMERFGVFDRDGGSDAETDDGLDAPEHRDLARRIAVEGTVLLRNDGALPLADDAELAVVGPNADEAKLGGGGSSEVTPFVQTSPVEGLRERAADCAFERGVDRIPESSLFDDIPGFGEEEGADDEDDDAPPADFDAAVAAAADADCAVVVVQDDTTEGKDREDLRLPGRQDELVAAVAEAAERTVVVVRSGGPVELPWLDRVDAVVGAWYAGQAEGEALAAVLYGDADPGGRLPVTFAPEEQYPTAEPGAFPGDDAVEYAEGVFVGYRYLDREGTEPTFPFGHGESYAAFEYGAPTVERNGDEVTLRVPVENVAERAGTEVVQAYVGEDDPAVSRPERELAGFEKVRLDPGERTTVAVDLHPDAFAYYEEGSGWTTPAGPYTVAAGRSSRDIRGTASVTLD
ncbi:beta-glucosidase [Halostella salina]|uniref:beta-glucosidase n=1 Tax=Halostella salina TaxID=1547897 RepID=UPI000EF7ED09|nr:glycoside hydrolase family 3 protein [Halostella salina]